MTTPIIICDDSNMARKQMARALPKDWDVEISFAEHGQDALEQLRQGKGDILFLDLNMPVLDGYQTLEAIRQEDLPTMVIVVSGDIQPEAHKRVTQLGALAFVKKPTSPEVAAEILQSYGLYSPGDSSDISSEPESSEISPAVQQTASANKSKLSAARAAIAAHKDVDLRDGLQEVTNVAMGRSADLLARLLDVFVVLPVPNVNILEVSELQMALSFTEQEDTYSAVCQGFIGSGIAGEALLIFSDSSFPDMASLLKYKGEISRAMELELLMDITSILSGAFIRGVGEQLDVSFSQGHPVILGQHVDIGNLIQTNSKRWKKTLTTEITYNIENHNITCELLLLFTEDSIDTIQQRLSYLFG